MAMHILLIESASLAQPESLLSGLKEQGHQVCVAHTPAAAATQVTDNWPNLVVINHNNLQPAFNMFHAAISQTELNIPYLVVSKDNQLASQSAAGIVVTDSNQPEALDKAITEATSRQADRFIRCGELTLDCEQHQLLRNGQSYRLTPKEFKLLHLLITNANQVSSRKSIMQAVWETNYLGDTRTLDVHIRWLREKIEENPSRPRHLITVRGVGYHFIAEPEESAPSIR
jgi:DNA-binding response OmpR family regulator